MIAMKIALLGGGGHAAVVAEAVTAAGEHDLLGFRDDDPTRHLSGLVHLGPISDVWTPPVVNGVAAAIGSPSLRRAWLTLAAANSMAAPPIVHPRAWVSPSARLGAGCVIMAGAVVQARAVIGDGAIVNTGASVDHDSEIGDYAHIAPGARLAGNVSVGSDAFIGMTACVIEGLRLGSRCLVAAGAVVIRDVPAGHRVAGVPAQLIR